MGQRMKTERESQEKQKKPKTVESYRKQILLWQVIGFAVCVLPLLITVYVKRGELIAGGSGIRVSAGLLIVLVVALLAVLGKMKMPGRVVSVGAAFAVSWLLESLLDNLVLLLGVLFAGILVDALVCETRVRKLQRTVERMENREDMTAATASALAQAMNGGNNE
ncbi:MAG: hypothetical protein ACI4PL_04500 [Faecousia sp.]